MNYLDGFSGYGGFHRAFELAGWKFDKCYFSEIDKHAIANYTYNFPNSIYAGSIDTICQSGIITELDLFTFGWPCQDNSIAGKRKGQQSGTRSGLLYEAVNVIDKFKPRNFVAENVAGLLSVNKGIDIVKSFEILSFLNESMPQYDIEMQLLNTRWFLPQNRERLFFVGHLRGSGSRQIFPIANLLGQDREENLFESHNNIAGTLNTKNNSEQMSIDKGTVLVISDRGASGAYIEKFDEIGSLSSRVGASHDHFVQIGTLRTQKEGGFRKMADSICPSILSRCRQDGSGQPCVEIENNTRRLTPLECERLQGLPDNHTQYGNYDGQIKEISDTQRYRLCGNGVSIPPVKAIAEALKY